MKNSSLITLVVCLVSLAGVVPATAQAAPGMKLTMPYAVTAGGVTLPAGECTITNMKDNGHTTIFLIRSAEGPAVELMTEETEPADHLKANESAVQLRRVGNNYEIDGIMIDGKAYKVN